MYYKSLTTIPSREYTQAGGNAEHLDRGGDIVFSAWKHAAVHKRTGRAQRTLSKIVSCDMPLGVPFNIAGASFLLTMVASITGHTAGVFTHFLHDVHIYANQVEDMYRQLERDPLPLPRLYGNPKICCLKDLETWVTVDDFELLQYGHHPAIKYKFAV